MSRSSRDEPLTDWLSCVNGLKAEILQGVSAFEQATSALRHSRRFGEFLARRLDHALKLNRKPGERLLLELADSLSSHSDLASDRIERLLLTDEAEAKLDDASLSLGELLERGSHSVSPQRISCDLGRIDGLRVGEEVSELTVAVVSDHLVQRDGCLNSIACLLDVLRLVARQHDELLQ